MVGTTKGAIASRPIGAALSEARKALVPKVSVRGLARRLGIPHSTLSRIENGHLRPQPELLSRIGAELGLSPARIGELMADIGTTEGVQWISTKRIDRRAQFQAVRAFEARATRIVSVLPTLIPGWCQIPAYTQAIMRAAGLPEWEVEERVRDRSDRAEILIRRRNPTSLTAFIGEEALHRVVGSPEVMNEQLLELLAWADPDRPHIDIRVVPQAVGWYPGMGGGYMIMDLPDQPSIVHIEHLTTIQFLSDQADLTDYLRAVDTVRIVAMSQADSRQLIAHVAQLHETAGSEHVA